MLQQEGLAKAYISIAEQDLVREHGEMYTAKLKKAKVKMTLRVSNGMPYMVLALERLLNVPVADDIVAALLECFQHP